MGGVADFISDTVGGVGDLIGQGTEWLGERTGLGFLDNFGEYVANDENAWIQNLLGAGALGGLGYGAFNYMMPTDGMFFGGSGLSSGLGMGDYGANELLTWGAGAGEGLGMSPTVAGFTQGASGLGSGWGLLGLGGLNLLGQYAGARAQQGMADDAWSRQLAAQQAYQATQRADIANAQNTALANWQQYGFPNQGAVQAGINQGKNTIKQNTKTSEQSMNEALAARGVGSGSGAIASAYGDLYKNQQNNIASLTNQMTQFGLTPYSAPPITMAYPGMPNVPNYAAPSSFGERTADMLSGITGQLGGIYAYDWLKNR